MPEIALKTQNLVFSFGPKKILNDLSFELYSNEIVSLIGASGSGKTTLFKVLTGLLCPESGTIEFQGVRDQAISYMTQENLLLPWRSVLGNLTLLSEIGSNPSPSTNLHAEALDILTDMGLENALDLYPSQLSGGMGQRVSLARCLLQKRPLLFLDEPFGALDVVLREKIYALLRKIKQKLGCSILMVTHDFHDAISLSDRIILMHEGSIQKSWEIKDEYRNDLFIMGSLSEDIKEELIKNDLS